jgi:hypothetical protein
MAAVTAPKKKHQQGTAVETGIRNKYKKVQEPTNYK